MLNGSLSPTNGSLSPTCGCIYSDACSGCVPSAGVSGWNRHANLVLGCLGAQRRLATLSGVLSNIVLTTSRYWRHAPRIRSPTGWNGWMKPPGRKRSRGCWAARRSPAPLGPMRPSCWRPAGDSHCSCQNVLAAHSPMRRTVLLTAVSHT